MNSAGLPYKITLITVAALSTLAVEATGVGASTLSQKDFGSVAVKTSPTDQGFLSLNEQQSTVVPEPEAILGCALALGIGALMRREFIKKNSK